MATSIDLGTNLGTNLGTDSRSTQPLRCGERTMLTMSSSPIMDPVRDDLSRLHSRCAARFCAEVQMVTRAQRMIGFGIFLAICGLLGWAAAGFTLKAKTALLSGSICGSMMIGCGWLLGRQHPWLSGAGNIGGTFLPLLFSAVFTWRASIAWMAWADGQPKFWVASLLGLMAAVGIWTFISLCTPWRKTRLNAASV